jgi:hypothetical protein
MIKILCIILKLFKKNERKIQEQKKNVLLWSIFIFMNVLSFFFMQGIFVI